MQFKRMFVDKILKGEKTQTRRHKIAWYKVGSIVPAQCGYREKAFARLKIIGIRKEKLGDITISDINKEGFLSSSEFIEIWKKINGSWNDTQKVYVIDFEIAKED